MWCVETLLFYKNSGEIFYLNHDKLKNWILGVQFLLCKRVPASCKLDTFDAGLMVLCFCGAMEKSMMSTSYFLNVFMCSNMCCSDLYRYERLRDSIMTIICILIHFRIKVCTMSRHYVVTHTGIRESDELCKHLLQ
jgi:hypothetical protein